MFHACLYSYFMPVCSILSQTITPRYHGQPDALLHWASYNSVSGRPDALLHEASCHSASGLPWHPGVIVLTHTTNRHGITVQTGIK